MKITNSFPNEIPKNWSTLSKLIKKKKNEPKIINENDLQIYIVTWNIHGKKPLKHHLDLILPKDKYYDMYIISTQECMRSIESSFFNDSKEEWIKLLKEYFDNSYINLIDEKLSAFHISVFVFSKIVNKFKNLQVSKVKTGFLNIMSNKGAVSVAMEYLTKKLCFICCHLSHGFGNSNKRNKDFERINSKLDFEPYENNNNDNNNINNNNINNNINKIENNNEHKTDYFDIVFWTGDFNYILNGNKEEINKMIKEKNYFVLKEYDQLNQEIRSHRIDIDDFEEGDIHFLPTYKFKDDSDEYVDYRIPGFNDRILYKSKIISDLELCKYSCIDEVHFSDHKPVYAIFKLNYSEKQSKKFSVIRKDKACCIF